MADRIELRGLTLRGFHGVLPEERRDGQPFVIDLVLTTDQRPAAQADDLTLTIDYAAVAAQVAAVVEGEPVDLIETLAQRIADAVLTNPLVEEVEVTVNKPEAPIPLPFANVAVRITRSRS